MVTPFSERHFANSSYFPSAGFRKATAVMPTKSIAVPIMR
jgi:hypothetical protein